MSFPYDMQKIVRLGLNGYVISVCVKSQPHSHRFRNTTAAWFITDDSHHHHPVTQSAAGKSPVTQTLVHVYGASRKKIIVDAVSPKILNKSPAGHSSLDR